MLWVFGQIVQNSSYLTLFCGL